MRTKKTTNEFFSETYKKMGPLVLGIVGLIGMIVLSLVAAVYPAKDLEDRYDQKNCVRPIFSMGFRDQNSDLQCKEMEDEYSSKYIEPCWKIRRGENVGVWARYRCFLMQLMG
jgi:hypothetical protein